MKIFPTTSIKQLDADTIKNEPIASIDLMERASRALARAIAERWEPDTPLTVFAGPGTTVAMRLPWRDCWPGRATGSRCISSIRKGRFRRTARRTRSGWPTCRAWTSTK